MGLTTSPMQNKYNIVFLFPYFVHELVSGEDDPSYLFYSESPGKLKKPPSTSNVLELMLAYLASQLQLKNSACDRPYFHSANVYLLSRNEKLLLFTSV